MKSVALLPETTPKYPPIPPFGRRFGALSKFHYLCGYEENQLVGSGFQ